MALSDFARLSIFYDGDALIYVTSIQGTTNSGQQRVDIMDVGLAGYTPGSGDVTISVGYAVPVAGTEKPYQADCANGRYVTLQLQQGAQYYIGQGKIMDVDVSGSAGANTEGTFNWTGELKPMEGG